MTCLLLPSPLTATAFAQGLNGLGGSDHYRLDKFNRQSQINSGQGTGGPDSFNNRNEEAISIDGLEHLGKTQNLAKDKVGLTTGQGILAALMAQGQ